MTSGHPLDPLFRPRSVAVVGASADPRKRGHQVLRAHQEAGYQGAVYPVNPRGGEILGLPVHASLEQLPEIPDLALLCTPAATIPDAVAACGRKGVHAAVVLAVGFRESGKEGAELERRLVEAARDEDDQVRRSALAALALAKDPDALEVIRERLREGGDDERLMALGALGNLQTPGALDTLAAQLRVQDSIIVRNAALLLANAGDARALPVVHAMLDRGSYHDDPALASPLRAQLDEGSRERVVDAATEQFLVRACAAAAALGSEAAVPALRALHESDPSLKVKSAAIDALHALGAVTES